MIAGAGWLQGWMAGLAAWSPAATGSLIAAVWQGVLLVALAGLVLRTLPKTPPAVRFAIWFGVFVVVAGLPLFSLDPHVVGTGAGGRSAWLTLDGRWSLAIAAVWALASAWRAGELVVAAFRVKGLWKRATPIAGFAEGDAKGGAAKQPTGRWGARRAPICTSDEVDRPTVIGFLAPKILIPGWLLEKLTPAELEQIVLHEAGHLHRADDWMNLLQKIGLVLFPLNPALAWVERRLCFERELAVDERVLHAFAGKPGAAKAYAQCLTTLAEHRMGRRGLALALGALGRESQLGRRIGQILSRRDRMRPLHARLVMGGAMLGLLAAATGFERCPEVVGFAPEVAGAPVATEAAFNQTAGGKFRAEMVTDRDTAAYRAVSTVYKRPVKRKIAALPNAANEARGPVQGTLEQREAEVGQRDVVDQPRAIQTASAAFSGTAAPRMIQTVAKVPDRASRLKARSDSEPNRARQAGVTMQWMVVTEWQGGESRMVMTTAMVPAGAKGGSAAAGAGRPEILSSESYEALPYAAVPVRGGWLVFQL